MIVCAYGKFDLNYGHPLGYYNPENLGLETTAELTVSEISNADSLKYMKKMFPNTYNEYCGILSDIARGI